MSTTEHIIHTVISANYSNLKSQTSNFLLIILIMIHSLCLSLKRGQCKSWQVRLLSLDDQIWTQNNAKMYWNLIWKSPRIVPLLPNFWLNLTSLTIPYQYTRRIHLHSRSSVKLIRHLDMEMTKVVSICNYVIAPYPAFSDLRFDPKFDQISSK